MNRSIQDFFVSVNFKSSIVYPLYPFLVNRFALNHINDSHIWVGQIKLP